MGELQDHDTSKTSCQHYVQLASNSMGADFTQIEIASSNDVFTGAPEVSSHNGEFLIYSIAANVTQIKQTRLGSAYDSITNSYGNTVITGNAVSEADFAFAILDGAGDYTTSQDLAACTDSEGRLYVVATYWANDGGTGSTKQVTIYRSDDTGANWSSVGTKGALSSGGDGSGGSLETVRHTPPITPRPHARGGSWWSAIMPPPRAMKTIASRLSIWAAGLLSPFPREGTIPRRSIRGHGPGLGYHSTSQTMWAGLQRAQLPQSL